MTVEEATKVLRSLYNVQRLDTLTQEEMTAVRMAIRSLEAWEKVKEEIKQWYWDADKQTLRTDPCVVDSMIDLFLRTINKHLKEVENANSN